MYSPWKRQNVDFQMHMSEKTQVDGAGYSFLVLNSNMTALNVESNKHFANCNSLTDLGHLFLSNTEAV